MRSWRRATVSGQPRILDSNQPAYYEEPQEAEAPLLKPSTWGKLFMVVALVTTSLVAFNYIDVHMIKAWYSYAQQNPAESMPIFVLLSALSVVCLCPGAIVGMLAGAVFGTWLGSVASFAGTFAGQCGAFLLGRYMFRDALAVWMVRRFPSWTTIETALFQQDGAKLVFLLRLSPLLPDSVMNYALALTSVGFSLFATATACAMIPYTALYCYVGAASKDIWATLRGGGDVGDARTQIAISVVSALLFTAFLVYLAVVLKRALAKAAAQRQKADASQLMDVVSQSGSASQPGGCGDDSTAVEMAPLLGHCSKSWQLAGPAPNSARHAHVQGQAGQATAPAPLSGTRQGLGAGSGPMGAITVQPQQLTPGWGTGRGLTMR